MRFWVRWLFRPGCLNCSPSNLNCSGTDLPYPEETILCPPLDAGLTTLEPHLILKPLLLLAVPKGITVASATPFRSFGFDEDTTYIYSHGYCWDLALALEEATGLTPVGVWGKGSIHHVGVELPNGDIMDIDGVWNRKHWAGFWEAEMDYCENFFVGPVSMDDEHWRNAVESFTPNLLTERDGPGFTLGEIRDRIITILNRYNLLPAV